MSEQGKKFSNYKISLTRSGDGQPDGLIQLVIVLAAALIFIPNLGFGLWDCWEPHYAETARMMLVRKDWLHPFWSYAYFLSKPILMFWYMAASMAVFGVKEWAIRLPFALHAVLLTWGVYFFVSRLFSRRAGVIAAVATATAPLTTFLGRQALADILVVTYTTLAVGFTALAVFGTPTEREQSPGELPPSDKSTPPESPETPERMEDSESSEGGKASDKAGSSVSSESPEPSDKAGSSASSESPEPSDRPESSVSSEPSETSETSDKSGASVSSGASGGLAGTGPFVSSTFLIYLSYFLLGLALLAKGLLGLAVPVAALGVYLLLSGDWNILLKIRIVSGSILMLAVALPWYLHMLTFPGRNIDDAKTFYQRFILHDNFYRLFKGVHGERGHFAYFIRQLGYSLGIWVAFLPFGLFSVGRWRRSLEGEDGSLPREEKLKRFLFAWWFGLFLLLTLSQTKFHHYVFPLVPISAILGALWLERFLARVDKKVYELYFLVALGVFGVVIRDVLLNPHHLVNLFVYKYSRPYPWSDPMLLWGINWKFEIPLINQVFYIAATPQNVMGLLTAVALTFFAGAYLRFSRKVVVWGLLSTAFVWALYHGQGWMPKLAKHWSQKYIFETLKKDSPYWRKLLSDPMADALKRPFPEEPLFAFRMNWRGEKFYSLNHDIQIMGTNSYTRLYEAFLRHKKPGRPVYFLTEATRMKELKRALGSFYSKYLKVIDRSNNKYILVKFTPPPPGVKPDPVQERRDQRTRRYYDNWNYRWRLKQRRKKKRR